MDASKAPTHEPVAVVVRFSKADLYRMILREFVRFPRLLGFLLPIACVAFFERRGGSGYYLSFALALFMFGAMPVIQIFRIRNHPGVDSDTQHVFSDSGISTAMGPLSNFAEWSFAASATEDERHLTVKFKSGAVVLPKNQLHDMELRQVRAIVRFNLKEKARLFTA
jgi:hypothetical protein